MECAVNVAGMGQVRNPNEDLVRICKGKRNLWGLGADESVILTWVWYNYHNLIKKMHTIRQNHNKVRICELLRVVVLAGPSSGSAELCKIIV